MSFTILIIDDDGWMREAVVGLLTTGGYRVLSAASGEDGLAMVQTVRVDLVLVDYHMPEMNGPEVVRQLRADDEMSRIPVVALTSAGAEHANALSLAGCVAVIPKPFASTELFRLVEELLRATAVRRPRGGAPRLEG